MVNVRFIWCAILISASLIDAAWASSAQPAATQTTAPAVVFALTPVGMFLRQNAATSQQVGSIRGMIRDRDFEAPLPLARIQIVETGAQTTATEDGLYLFEGVAAGTYTLVFSKDGYARQVRPNVIVNAGQVTESDAELSGEFTEMEEFIVEDIQIAGTEGALLKLRIENPALLDSISADLMSRAGASDAASALSLVAGATVQDGKFAVIRGLPDRYVNSQMNGVRLPTADEDKRAVELDQFPSPVIESIQVSKTFTPDQQGDASGGAVNVILKGIPDETIIQFKSQVSFNSQAAGSDFLTYQGGGLNTWGNDDGDRDIQFDNLGDNWDGAVGVSRGDAPVDHKWSLSAGSKFELNDDITIGAFGSVFYERDSSFFDNGVDDGWWVTTPGGPMVPETTQGVPDPDGGGDFKTKLFDVTQGSQSVQWGGLGILGMESENHALTMTYLYTHAAEDVATLAEDTRGKAYFFPGYDPNDPIGPGNDPSSLSAAPYIRTETLEYTERTTQTLQFHGEHTLTVGGFGVDDLVEFDDPVLDWTVAFSSADLYQPDKRQFGSIWLPESFNPGFPPFIPPFTSPALHLPFQPAQSFLLGNLQRIWKEINEESEQYSINLTLPFSQWTDSKGYLKFGVFHDDLHRKFDQETFSNNNEGSTSYEADFYDFWSAVFPFEDHFITDGPPFIDIDYRGHQVISAWYGMADIPINNWLNVIGGARVESTELSIVNDAEPDATWLPPGSVNPISLLPGAADVDFSQDDVLPSIGLVIRPTDTLTFRANYAETVARQTFKELTPIQQQEYLGAEVFIGNPELQMSALKNYDLRLDFTPTAGSLYSISWFHKDITDPIEYVQRVGSFTYTTAVNYPSGELSGFEFEARQDLGQIWDSLTGLSLGANATIIDSEVILPDDEAAEFDAPNIMAPMSSRDMTNAPEFLYNIYFTYDLEATGTQFALFYTVKGDTLVAGAGQSNGNFVPNVYALEYGTLNFSVSQKLWKYFTLQFQAKNLTNEDIQEVYRSPYIGGDVLKTSYSKGIEFAIGLSAEIKF